MKQATDMFALYGAREVLLSTTLMAEENVVPFMTQLVEGKIINWSENDALRKTAVQLFTPDSPTAKAVRSALLSKDPGVRDSLLLLADRIDIFDPDKDVFTPTQFTECYCLAAISVYALASKDVKPHDHHTDEKIIQRLEETLLNQQKKIEKRFSEAGMDDLLLVFRIADVLNLADDAISISKGFERKKRRILKNPGEEVNPFLKEVNESVLKTWNRLRQGWKWQQIADVANQLPYFVSQRTINYALITIADNLLHNATPQTRIELTPEAAAILVEKGVDTHAKLSEKGKILFPKVAKDQEGKLTFSDGFSVPKKHVPSVAVEILQHIAIADPEKAISLLQETHAQLKTGEKKAIRWFITLVALRASVPALSEQATILAQDINLIPPQVLAVIAGQEKGAISYDPTATRKLRVNSSSPSSYSLFISAVEAQTPELVDALETSQTEVEIETAFPQSVETRANVPVLPFLGSVETRSNVPVLPFIGSVEQVVPEQTAEVVKRMFAGSEAEKKWEILFEKFYKLRDARRGKNIHSKVVYDPRTYKGIQLDAARAYGIDAVAIEKGSITFVLDPKIACSADGKPVCITGTLDEKNRELVLDGIDDPRFNGTAEQLALNILALDLATQTVTTVNRLNKDELREVHGQTADWNRGRMFENELDPKIPDVYIAATINGMKEPVLFGERRKS